MLKKILLVVVAVVAVLVATIASRPGSYEVQRSATVAAPPEVVYAQVADFGRWGAWSPWAKLDPAMKTELRGAPGAVGHGYSWTGDDKVGEGRMTIVEAEPARRVGIKLEFLKPFESTNPTRFTFAPEGAGTRVTWTMSGQSGFAMKAMSLFMDFEKSIGTDFEKGLAQLKAAAEAAGTASAAQGQPPAAAPSR